jgi:hypothetical protein
VAAHLQQQSVLWEEGRAFTALLAPVLPQADPIVVLVAPWHRDPSQRAVYAMQPLPVGRVVLLYTGPCHLHEPRPVPGQHYDVFTVSVRATDTLEILGECFVTPDRDNSVCRLFNHACQPNLVA